MPDLKQQLLALNSSPLLWLGLGNADGGDDAAGLRLAESLHHLHLPNVSTAALHPEHWIAHAHIPHSAHVIFLDAADFGAPPGSAALFDAAQIQSRYPQISTHRIALSTLARLMVDRGAAGVWLLAIQPVSLQSGGLSPVVQLTIDLLARIIVHHLGPPALASSHDNMPDHRPGPFPVPCLTSTAQQGGPK